MTEIKTKEENDAYDQGVDAGHAGWSDLDNPYEIGTDESMSWMDGLESIYGDEND